MEDACGEENPDQGFDDSVAWRNGVLTFAAAPANEEPPQHWDVEVRFDGLATIRASGTPYQRFAARQAIDTNVEKAAKGESEDESDEGCFSDWKVGHVGLKFTSGSERERVIGEERR